MTNFVTGNTFLPFKVPEMPLAAVFGWNCDKKRRWWKEKCNCVNFRLVIFAN